MIFSRRKLLWLGGLTLAGLSSGAIADNGIEEIKMVGTANGADVWFDPLGIRVIAGTTIRWRNDDLGNSHTATSFHPSNAGHSLRIPREAEPWDSGYLLPGETFSVTLRVPGVYDYFCLPHEMAGMVGRVVVTAPNGASPMAASGMETVFPSVAEILRKTRIEGRASLSSHSGAKK